MVTLTGQDTIIIAGRNITDLADGDVGTLDFPNDKVGVKTGKNGNTIYALNATGANADVVLRVLRGSPDDAFMNSLLTQQDLDFATFPLMSGTIQKRIGKGDGQVTNDTYRLQGGVFQRGTGVSSNVEGQTDQGVAVYTMKFALAPRNLF